MPKYASSDAVAVAGRQFDGGIRVSAPAAVPP